MLFWLPRVGLFWLLALRRLLPLLPTPTAPLLARITSERAFKLDPAKCLL